MDRRGPEYTALPADPCRDHSPISVGPTAADLATALSEQPFLTVTKPTEVTVGGMKGLVVKATVPKDGALGQFLWIKIFYATMTSGRRTRPHPAATVLAAVVRRRRSARPPPLLLGLATAPGRRHRRTPLGSRAPQRHHRRAAPTT